VNVDDDARKLLRPAPGRPPARPCPSLLRRYRRRRRPECDGTPARLEGVPLTPCEHDVLAALGEASHRLTTRQLLSRLEQSGRLHGERTVTRGLARLVRLGLVCSSRRIPRGYYLPGKPYPLRLDAGVAGQPHEKMP
jgi:hypothetical protein